MAESNNHIDQELFERIEAYILNNMDANNKAIFEREMQASESLRNEVALQRKLMATVSVLSHEYGRDDTSIKKTGKTNRSWVYVAAAAVLLMFVLLRFFNNQPPTEKVFATFFTPDTGLPVAMSSNDNYTFYDGMISYKEEDYPKALAIWKSITTTSDTLSYYTGMAYVNSGDMGQAIEVLTPIAENDNSGWRQKASWYLALAFIKQQKITEAIRWLSKAPETDEKTQLLRKLEALQHKK